MAGRPCACRPDCPRTVWGSQRKIHLRCQEEIRSQRKRHARQPIVDLAPEVIERIIDHHLAVLKYQRAKAVTRVDSLWRSARS